MNQLKIGNFIFEIDPKTSFLEEYNDEFTKWNLKINTKQGLFEDDYACAPNLRCEEMLADFGSLQNLQNTDFEIKKAYDYVTDEHLFTFYLASHSAVKDNKISFGTIKNGMIDLKWSAVIEDMYFSDAFSTNTPFEITCTIPVKTLDANEYRSPTIVTNEWLDTQSNDYTINENILSEIDEITQTYTLNTATYDSIVQLLCNKAFVNSFAGNENDLNFFIANFTYYPTDRACAITEGVGAKALETWRGVEGLKGVIEGIG